MSRPYHTLRERWFRRKSAQWFDRFRVAAAARIQAAAYGAAERKFLELEARAFEGMAHRGSVSEMARSEESLAAIPPRNGGKAND